MNSGEYSMLTIGCNWSGNIRCGLVIGWSLIDLS